MSVINSVGNSVERPYDLLLRGATLADGSRADIGLRDGLIAHVAPALSGPSVAVEELDGQLALPSFVDLHMHLDKAFTLELTDNASGTLQEAIVRYGELGPRLTRQSFVERALRTLRLCAAAGTTALRTHVNVGGEPGGLLAMEALLEVRERVREWLDVQVVVLAGGLAWDERTRWACEEALRLGADFVGGAPALDLDPQAAVRAAFDLAMRFDRDLDLHVDESDEPTVRTLSHIADLALREGYVGRVTAGHCCSLAAMDDAAAAEIIARVAAARITVVTLPSCNLYLQGRHDRQPIRRGLTRVKELLAAGVNVAAASDNIRDPFNPFGRGDLLHIADLLAHAAHLGSPAEQAQARDAITANPRACFTGQDPSLLRGGALREGDPADLVVCATRSVGDLIAAAPVRTLVLRRGHIVARSRAEGSLAF